MEHTLNLTIVASQGDKEISLYLHQGFDEATFYCFKTDRKHENVYDLIGDYRGLLHSDKHAAYERLAAEKKITWCPCYSHIRRKFFEAKSDPEFRNWILKKIRYLFLFEKVAWNRSPEERLKIRQEKEVPIIDELIAAERS
jgi:hypothetical protein